MLLGLPSLSAILNKRAGTGFLSLSTLAIDAVNARQATSIKCDVSQWDDLVALFELAIAKYGHVDIVVRPKGSQRFNTKLMSLPRDLLGPQCRYFGSGGF